MKGDNGEKFVVGNWEMHTNAAAAGDGALVGSTSLDTCQFLEIFRAGMSALQGRSEKNQRQGREQVTNA